MQVFLWSSLPNAAQVSGGKWEVAHFSDKAKASAEWMNRQSLQSARLLSCFRVHADSFSVAAA